MPAPKTYNLEPTPLVPNSPYPLIHYPRFFGSDGRNLDALTAYRSFLVNGWETQWIARYGPSQRAHYHSKTHECMTVLSGTATIRFGAADADDDMQTNTNGAGHEGGGVEIHAEPGDVFVIPAGVSHKTFDAKPVAESGFLIPGDGHRTAGGNVEETLKDVKLNGFTMIGAYQHGGEWDFSVGGEHAGRYETVWSVPKPARDPVLGEEREGLSGLWI
ncbi:Uu.00g006110.m01.CDS01 [Anthostomella pinea]|uniref:Uu.00g006110.m01.CDS01 n=1 Tax=Anthostomella pinea TaxID=933095 RepID=A0AAI8YIV3_9PEZI|nr:Uu.00g006110.m01.CDS01 [Anthostomella pinea]